MEKLELEWDITAEEARERTLQSIPVIVGISVSLALWLALEVQSWAVFFLSVGILVVYIIFRVTLATARHRSYRIAETGITISRGAKRKTYTWDTFDFFVQHSIVLNKSVGGAVDASARTARSTIAAIDQLTEINGSVYYLKKKRQTIWDVLSKRFVVVYAEPDNSTDVEQILSHYVPHKPLDGLTEAGMVHYEFK